MSFVAVLTHPEIPIHDVMKFLAEHYVPVVRLVSIFVLAVATSWAIFVLAYRYYFRNVTVTPPSEALYSEDYDDDVSDDSQVKRTNPPVGVARMVSNPYHSGTKLRTLIKQNVETWMRNKYGKDPLLSDLPSEETILEMLQSSDLTFDDKPTSDNN